MKRNVLGLAALATTWLACVVTLLSDQPAQAQTHSKRRPAAEPSKAKCVLQGISQPQANAAIEDARGQVIARFSGAPTQIVASRFPQTPGGRVHVQTGTGTGSFRLGGLTRVGELSFYSKSPIAVVPRHVFIGAGQRLSFLGSAAGKLRVEHRASAPFAQSVTTWAPCSAIALEPTPAPGAPPRGEARGYVQRASRLDLYDLPGRDDGAIFTLLRSPDSTGALFFSNERRGEWVRVEHQRELIIDAWARAGDLQALPPGETMDQLASAGAARLPARLAVQGEPRVVRVPHEVPLRMRARGKDSPIGVIEADTETYVLDVVMGWASVMPKSLNVVPGPDGQFWAKASDLGL